MLDAATAGTDGYCPSCGSPMHNNCGELPVSDTTTKHAAEVIEPFIEDLYYGDPCVIADALAAAGLLCTPQERAVIDAAIEWRHWNPIAEQLTGLSAQLLAASVDRLAAPEPEEAT